MLGSLVMIAIISTPIIGLVWLAFIVWEAMERP